MALNHPQFTAESGPIGSNQCMATFAARWSMGTIAEPFGKLSFSRVFSQLSPLPDWVPRSLFPASVTWLSNGFSLHFAAQRYVSTSPLHASDVRSTFTPCAFSTSITLVHCAGTMYARGTLTV